jgi:hypothetical protein
MAMSTYLALDALRAEFEARGVPVKDGHWGYRLLVVEDLDGNQLFFNYPNEPSQPQRSGELGVDAIDPSLLQCVRWQWAGDDGCRSKTETDRYRMT